MGKSKRLRKRITKFVSGLSDDTVREQLILAYLQMERCINVLRGYDVEPVEMMDNGDSTDLELFYRCKKASAEIEQLNLLTENPEGISLVVDEKDAHTLAESFFMEAVKKHMAEEEVIRFVKIGQKVYHLYGGRIHRSVIKSDEGVDEGTGLTICRMEGYDNPIFLNNVYESAKQLVEYIGYRVEDHISYSSDHEPAFFIDDKSRIFVAAKWYLEEKKIEHFATLDELGKFLLKNVIDDGKGEG